MFHVMAYNKDRDVYNELALADNYANRNNNHCILHPSGPR